MKDASKRHVAVTEFSRLQSKVRVLGEEVRNLCCSAAVPLDHTIGSENSIDFKVSKDHHISLSQTTAGPADT
jgi:hypothetical protein